MSTRLNMGQISGLTGSLTELESEISTEEYRVDSILSGSTASLDSFGEASVEISNIKNSITSVLQGSTSSMDTFSEVYNTLQSLENRINGMSSGATGPQGATGSTGATGSAGATGSSTYFKYLKNHYQTFSDTASLGGSSYTQAMLTNTLMAFPIEIKAEATIQSLRYVNVSGVAVSNTNYIAYRVNCPARDSITLTLGITMNAGSNISVNANSSLMSFSAFGTEIY